MIKIYKDELKQALQGLGKGLNKYRALQELFHIQKVDVSTHKYFQKKFIGFYRMGRKSDKWYKKYYELLQQGRKRKLSYKYALEELYVIPQNGTHKIEASFASKLIATIDPDLPVIDKYVLNNIFRSVPAPNKKLKPNKQFENRRLEKTVYTYELIKNDFKQYLASPEGKKTIEAFDRAYPESGLTNTKKLDLILWQIR